MEYPSSLSDKKPFCLQEGGGEEIISFVAGLYLPVPIPGSLEYRQEKAERILENFGKPDREAKPLSELFSSQIRRSFEVSQFFSEWHKILPDLSRCYRFSKLEGEEVLIESLHFSRLKRKKFDEARIEKALNDHLRSGKVAVKIVQNIKK